MAGQPSSRVLARFASVLATIDTDLEPATRLCECARITLGADAASVAIRLLSGGWSVLAATAPATERFEHVQQLAGEGPARDAAETGEALFVPVAQAGLSAWSTLSVVAERDVISGNYWVAPMRPVRVVIGSLTLHRGDGDLLEDLPEVQYIADTVGSALVGDGVSRESAPAVTGDWADRAEIHQATGMVVAQMRVSPDDALAMLRAHAFSQNRDLHAVALDVVSRAIDFSTGGE